MTLKNKYMPYFKDLTEKEQQPFIDAASDALNGLYDLGGGKKFHQSTANDFYPAEFNDDVVFEVANRIYQFSITRADEIMKERFKDIDKEIQSIELMGNDFEEQYLEKRIIDMCRIITIERLVPLNF
jgi:hypothetical protein